MASTSWDPSTAEVPGPYYYFAYGSNLWLEQMKERCPQFTYIGKGVLRDHKWIINTRHYANLIPLKKNAGEKKLENDTYGIIYTLSKFDMDSLDKSEGVGKTPPSYCKYTRDVEMYCWQGRVLKKSTITPCLVYVDPRTGTGVAKQEYKERMKKGLRDARLPEEWVKKVVMPWIWDGESEGEIEEEDLGERKGAMPN